jgi:calcineurin-like phosphoesterase family protein
VATYYLGDSHFDHKNIIKYSNRPFKSVVRKTDTVWHLGDFAMTSDPDDVANVLKKLNGVKHLIRGNHDYLSHKQYLQCGFASSQASWKMSDQGHKLHLHHKPIALAIGCDWQVHGHIHSPEWRSLSDRHINTCVDVQGFKPLPIQELTRFKF